MSLPTPARPEWHLHRHPLADTGLTVRYVYLQDLEEAELDGILELLRRAFNGGPSWFRWGTSPRDHLIWKTADRPGLATIQLTEDGDRIVGYSVGMPCRFLLRGSEITARQGYDSALDPEYQGRRINSAREGLGEQLSLNDGSCVAIGLGMHPTGNQRRGTGRNTAIANSLDTLVKPLSLGGLIASRGRAPGDSSAGTSRTREVLEAGGRRLPGLPSAGRVGLAARLGWSLVRPRRGAGRETWELRTVDEFDDRADDFWAEAASAFDFIQVRDREYLNWRFCDPRGAAFTVRAAEEDGQLLGYTALRFDQRGAVLADMLTRPGRSDVARSLIADAVALSRQQQSPLLRCWLPHTHPYRSVLADLGFVHYETPMTFNYRARECDSGELLFLEDPGARVHYMTADSDHI